MTRVPLLFLALLAACADGAEVPPLEIGGGGVRAMTGNAKTPVEAYENAYAQIHRQTQNVLRALQNRGQNLYAAREGMAALAHAVETMRSVAAPLERPRFDPYVARYRGWLSDLDRNVWGGSFLSDVEQSAVEVKTRFSPASIEILAEFPGAATAQSPPPPAAPPPGTKPPASGVPEDKALLPPPGATPSSPSAAPTAPPGATPPPAAVPAASARLLYKAWDRAHDDLVASVKAKKDARRNYEDVMESLRLLKAQTAEPDRVKKLEIYLDYYAAVHEKTKGFTAPPEGEKATEKDVADELDVAARVIRSLFNPDK